MHKAFAFLTVLGAAACMRSGAPEIETGANADPLFGTRKALGVAELAWTAVDADKISILTERPPECLRTPADPDANYLVEVGRAAFSSPMLFGGPAARGGLSCQSCHLNGHDNDAFFLRGLSGAPGTADVTSSLFSKTREDGQFNPVVIPTLVGIVGKDAFGTAKPAPSLHDFIKSAVSEEFQGAAATETVVDGLAAYVAHLDRAACTEMRMPRTAGRDMADAARIVKAAVAALAQSDSATADFLIVSARQALGRVHERFPGSAFKAERELLVRLSGRLAGARAAVRDGMLGADAQLDDIEQMIARAGARLDDSSAGSLYDERALKAALGLVDSL